MSFARLHVTAEGPTEERFVKHVLCSHLGAFQVATDVRSVLTSKDKRTGREYRGGLRHYDRAKRDIETWLKEDARAEAYFTTMFDVYALPEDFPAFEDSRKLADPYERVDRLEAAFADDIGDPRFLPYLQLHEFETLLFVDPGVLAKEYLEHDVQINALREVPGKFSNNPELINDGVQTAPSKRLLKQIPEYDKATVGPGLVAQIGIDALRSRCRHFGEWLARLEELTK